MQHLFDYVCIHILCAYHLYNISYLSLSLYIYICCALLAFFCFACFALLALGWFRDRFGNVLGWFGVLSGSVGDNCFPIRYTMFTSHTLCMLYTTYTVHTMHVLIVHNVWIGHYIHAMCVCVLWTMHAYTMCTWHSMYNTVYTIYSRSHCIHRIESSKAAWSG